MPNDVTGFVRDDTFSGTGKLLWGRRLFCSKKRRRKVFRGGNNKITKKN